MDTEPVLMMVGVDCAKGREQEFNDWYNATFPPILKGVDGVVRIDRYVRVESDESYPTFLSVVQFESEAAMASMAENEAVKELGKAYFEAGVRWGTSLRWSIRYKRIYSSEA
jgi:hypothetical protein